MEMIYWVKLVNAGGTLGPERALDILHAAGLRASSTTSCYPRYGAIKVTTDRKGHIRAHELIYREGLK